MGDEKLEEWLPAGWTVELKVRKNGKKDKFYIPPVGGIKCNSKVEVSRYLEAEQIKRNESMLKKKGRCKRPAGYTAVEKVTAEGLPPGWIKEIRVRKKDRTIKRDPYYTDPVSGYVFRSMKDVLRYLNSGELGRLAFKPKDSCGGDTKLEDDKISSLAEAEKNNLVSSKTSSSIEVVTDHCLKSNGIIKEAKLLKSACVGESILSHQTSEKYGEGTALKDPKQKERKIDIDKSNCATPPADGTLPEKILSKDRVVKRRKSKGNQDPSFPRRSSKRLAGLEVDPTPELQTTNRARRLTDRLVGGAEANKIKGFALDSSGHQASRFAQLAAEPISGCTLNTSRSTELLDQRTLENPVGNLATPKEHTGNVDVEKVVEIQEYLPISPLGNQIISEDHAGKVKTETNKADAEPEKPFVLPFGDSWLDPCIEFAVKTLTGAIPLEDDQNIQDYFDHQLNSSQNLVSSKISIEDVTDRCLKSNGMTKDDQILYSACMGESIVSHHTSDKCGVGSDPSSSNATEAKDSNQKERNINIDASNSAITPTDGILPEKKPSKYRVVRHSKSKDKKDPSFPRRSSKRLAGLEVDTTLVLQTGKRACRLTARLSGGAEASKIKGFTQNSSGPQASQRFTQLEAEPELGCTLHTSRRTEILLGRSNSKNPVGDLVTLEEHTANVNVKNQVTEKQEYPPGLPLGNHISEELAGEIETKTNKANAEVEQPLVPPFGDSWLDPCIEFAVKTLTGAIPFEDDLNIQDYLEHQLSLSQGDCSSSLPSFSSQNCCQTNLWSQEFYSAEKATLRQQALVEPALPQTGNKSLHFPGESDFGKNGEEKQ